MLKKRSLKTLFLLLFHTATRTNLHSTSSWKGLQTSKIKKAGTSISLFFCKRNNFISNVFKHFTKVQNLDYFKGPFQPEHVCQPMAQSPTKWDSRFALGRAGNSFFHWENGNCIYEYSQRKANVDWRGISTYIYVHIQITTYSFCSPSSDKVSYRMVILLPLKWCNTFIQVSIWFWVHVKIKIWTSIEKKKKKKIQYYIHT